VPDSVQLVVHLSHTRAIHTGRLLVRIDSAISADPATVPAQVQSARAQENQALREPSIQR
jgi:hypothetical protein